MDYKQNISQALNDYITQTGKSAAKVADEISTQSGRLSEATISKIRNGKGYEQISERMFRRVASYLGIDKWVSVETDNLSNIFNLCKTARREGCMRGVVGYTGAGKTTAFKMFQKQNNGVYYLLCKESMSKREFARAIAEVLGITDEGTTYSLIRKIAAKLRGSKQAKPLLILDDAGKMNDKKLAIVQEIYDEADGAAGIVLGGVSYLYDNLAKAAKLNKKGMPELNRRVGGWLVLDQAQNSPSRAEVSAICQANGVSTEDINQFVKANFANFGDLREAIINYFNNQES